MSSDKSNLSFNKLNTIQILNKLNKQDDKIDGINVQTKIRVPRKSLTTLMLEKTINHNDKLKFIEEMKKLKRRDDASVIYKLMRET